jgi:ferredoxin--NADP+ reductase
MERPPNATIVSRYDANERLVVLRVRHDTEPVPDFVPGQFLKLGLPRAAPDTSRAAPDPSRAAPDPSRAAPDPSRAAPDPSDVAPGDLTKRRVKFDSRAYSIASSPFDKVGFELLIALVAEGRLTPRLWDLQAGGRCWLDPKPLGTFTLDGVGREKHLLFVGTGTGVVPYVSMARSYARGRPGHDHGHWRTCTILHGVRIASDLVHLDELNAISRNDPTIRYLPMVTREPETSAWSGLRGRVGSLIEGNCWECWGGAPLDPSQWHVYLCGNPEMIGELRDKLGPLGFATGTSEHPGNLHVERYW